MRQTTVFLFVLSQGVGKRLLRGGETLTGVPGAVKGLEMQERKDRPGYKRSFAGDGARAGGGRCSFTVKQCCSLATQIL